VTATRDRALDAAEKARSAIFEAHESSGMDAETCGLLTVAHRRLTGCLGDVAEGLWESARTNGELAVEGLEEKVYELPVEQAGVVRTVIARVTIFGQELDAAQREAEAR
jgi:hypothetical protein